GSFAGDEEEDAAHRAAIPATSKSAAASATSLSSNDQPSRDRTSAAGTTGTTGSTSVGSIGEIAGVGSVGTSSGGFSFTTGPVPAPASGYNGAYHGRSPGRAVREEVSP